METCKGVIQEGTRKGERCKFPPGETNLYCKRHQRNYEYDTLVETGKKPCRFFFRGCNNILEDTEKSPSCKTCREKLSKKSTPCGHEGCNFKTEGSKYCKKHERDVYYDEQKEKGIKYCDIARGCFTILEGGLKTCQGCLDNENEATKKRFQKRRDLHNALESVKNSTYQICIKCGKEFEKYLTHANYTSKLCKHCNQTQKNQDAKREDRVRIFKQEKLKNIPSYYKDYINSAFKRGYAMDLQFDDFKELVQKPCYYCNTYKDDELNGIDRIDNTKGYTKENAVACCGVCNRMKLNYHPLFFVEKCKLISAQDKNIDMFVAKWKEYYTRYTDQSYLAYKNRAEIERNMTFKITEDEWKTYMNQPCYLCNYRNPNKVGLDRIDNTIREYSVENVKTCCGSCNLMKGEVSLPEFLEKVELINNHWVNLTVFESIPHDKDSIKINMKKIRNKLSNTSDRTSWKALGVYYSVMGDSNEFYETQKDIYTLEKYNKLKEMIMTSPKDEAVLEIKRVLVALKKQRQRAS